jgi:hypothetical protein
MERKAEKIWLMLTAECNMFDGALKEVGPRSTVHMYCAANGGQAVAQLVEALRGRGFDSQ